MNDPRAWMRLAVDLGKQSIAEDGRDDPPPRVGVVLVREGEFVASGFRGATGVGDHAEFGMLKELSADQTAGAELFTTLEPCSRRNHPKKPCAEHVVQKGVRVVWIGVYDPDPRIFREGWRMLRDAGVELRDFDADFRAEIAADNSEFLDKFRTSRGDSGTARFDHSVNDGAFDIRIDGEVLRTRWGPCGQSSVWAYGVGRESVANARYAGNFSQIDEPGALPHTDRAVQADVGNVISFRFKRTYVLVRIVEVHGGIDRGADRMELSIEWEVRRPRR